MDLEISEIHKKPDATATSRPNKVDAKGRESKSAAIKYKWHGFVKSSTLHGLKHVFASHTPLRRIIWATFLFSTICWFFFQSFMLITKYHSRPVTSKVTLVYEDAPEFPAITICNFNKFKSSAVKEMGYEELVKYVLRKGTKDVSKLYSLNLTEFYFATGHQIKDTLVKCSWNGDGCSTESFTAVLTSMGLCHTFNSGKNGQQILKAKQEGADFGLHLELNVQQYEYDVTGYRAGLKVLIHHHDTPPMVSQLGFAVSPGTSTYAAIHKQKIKNLAAPYESNCFEKNDTNIPGYTKYTTLACMQTCETKHVVQKCGCRDALMSDVRNASVCNPLEVTSCVLREKENFQKQKSHRCDCPVPCEIISFKPVLSYAAFPSYQYIVKITERKGGSNVSEDTLEETHRKLSQNWLGLNIYFQELNYHFIEQKAAYEWDSLLAEIGGQIGLCAGASLLTVLEFCDVILEIIGIRLGFR